MVKQYNFFKNTFLLNTLIGFWIFYSSLYLLIYFSTSDNTDKERYIFFILSLFFVLISFLPIFLFSQKVFVNQNGIEIKHYNKSVILVKWDDILSVSIGSRNRTRCIIFNIDNSIKELYFEINKKKLSYLKKSCTNIKILNELTNIKLSFFL